VNIDIKTNIFDKEELHTNCTVQILSNSATGEVSVGWWENPGWVRVEDQLPEMGKHVLVMFDAGDMAVAFVFERDEYWSYWRAVTDDGWTADCDCEPIWWMPLPEPPEER